MIDRGADIKARSIASAHGNGPALGKSGDPRKAVAAQGAALAAGTPLQLGQLNTRGDSTAATAQELAAIKRGTQQQVAAAAASLKVRQHGDVFDIEMIGLNFYLNES